MSPRGKLLITGATGFIGTHLVEYLSRHAHLDLRLQVHTRPPRRGWERFEIVRGSLLEPEAFQSWAEGVDYVIHAAADTDVAAATVSPERSLEVNCLATMHLLDEFRDRALKRFVYISSARVYGRTQYLPIDERHPFFVEDPYGASKLAGGVYVDLYHRLYKIPTVNLVVFSVYGPGQHPYRNTGVLAIFARKVVDGEDLTIFGDGSFHRDLLHVQDLCRAVELALAEDKATGQVMNVGTGKGTTIRELAELAIDVGRELGYTKTKIRTDKPLPGDVSNYADITKIRSELGFHPKVALRDGIKEYMEWYAREGRR